MDKVQAQYEAYPYPERDPREEKKRLITGSPSWPQEMDHWLWGGSRDWSKPLRVLIAGGGTGDGMIQLAQVMTSAGRPYDITYLDLSKASRDIAKARAATRGLTGINFVTDSLLNAPEFGKFDYIDCCGVLHHLPNPQAGFNALASALSPGGGIGIMVYAPHGRSGVYPLQAAFGKLTEGMNPNDQLRLAKSVFKSVPEDHPFKCNPNVVDHKASEAGFYDLLLHSIDRPYRITDLLETMDIAGLELAGVPEPAMYDPSQFAKNVDLSNLSDPEKMQLAEDLRGTFKTHIVYATLKGTGVNPPLGTPNAIPHLRGVQATHLAKSVAKTGEIRVTAGGKKHRIAINKSSAKLIAGIDGRRDLKALQNGANMDPIAFKAAWSPFETAMKGFGILHYSNIFKGL